MRMAKGEERRERGERMQRTNKRERERMNKIYYFCLQFDVQFVVNMETDCSQMLNNFGFPSSNGDLFFGFGC